MKIKIIGNGLDALICSKKLLELGHQIQLLSTTRSLGGHFLGHTNGHGKFDSGMVLLENDHRSVPPSELDEYNNHFGRNLRPFLLESFEWLLNSIGGSEQELVVTKLSSGDEVPDYFIADNLNFLDCLDEEIRNDLLFNIEKFMYHSNDATKIQPSKKMFDRMFDELSISDYYTQIFGRKFYEVYFENFLTNVAPGSFQRRARDHRKFWLPLYFPESIYFRIKRDPKYEQFSLPEIRFDRPKDMMISDVVTKIAEEIFAHPNFEHIVFEKFSTISVKQFENEKILFFLPLEQLSSVLPETSRLKFLQGEIVASLDILGSTSINIVHACIPKNISKTVLFQSDFHGLFRHSVSQQRGKLNSSVASFEFKDSIDFDLADSLKIIHTLGFDVLCEGSHLQSPFKPRSLSLSELDWLELAKSVAAEFDENNVYGPAIHPEATSFNDNLVRGLAHAVQIHRRG